MADAVKSFLSQRYYTPWQICVAAVIGGPVTSGYLSYRNHSMFGDRSKARLALAAGVGLCVALVALGFNLPEGKSGTALAGAVAGGYRWCGQSAFASEIARRNGEGWRPQSWWHVLGLSLAFLVALLLSLVILVVLLDGNTV